jgi:FHA domain
VAFTLTIASGPDTGTAFPFEAKQAKFGRTADNDVVVKDGSASRSHCKVYEEGGKYFLEDLKSANGTKLNGNLVEGTVDLHNGDKITIGDVSFDFTTPDATMMQPAYDGPAPVDANSTMIGMPSGMEIPPPDEPPVDPNATFLKSPDELEAIKASWKEKAGGGAAAGKPAAGPTTAPDAAPLDANATFLKSPAELEAIKASWKEKAGGAPAAKPAPAPAESDSAPVDANSTMLKSPEELAALREGWKKQGLAPEDSGPSTNPVMDTGPITNPDMKVGDATEPPKAARPKSSPGKALAKRDDDEGLQPSGGDSTKEVPGLAGKRAPLARSKKDEAPDEPSQMTAAEKARVKRELGNSLKGRLLLYWDGLSPRRRKVTAAGGGAIGLLFLSLLVYALWPATVKPGKPLPPEPTALVGNAAWIEQSFGAGDDVDYKRPDLKQFTFNTQSPTRVVAILHYQAKDISKDEVAVSLNAAEVGWVAPDTIDVNNRELELVFPSNLVKLNEDNILVFDNVRSPPADDPWRVWNIWLEVLPMPDLTQEEAITEARATVERAKKAYDLREVGPENLFKAWKQYRQAWLLLESIQDRPPELYDFVRQQMKQIVPEMDKRCANLLLEVKKEMESPTANYKRVRDMLENVTSFFPTREHRCNPVSKQILGDLSG